MNSKNEKHPRPYQVCECFNLRNVLYEILYHNWAFLSRLNLKKEMAMLERNDKGKQVRRYFIQIEKKYRKGIPQKQPKKIPLASVNKAVSNIDRIFSRAGVNELYIAAEAKRLYSEAGYEIKIPLITDKETMPKLYDCTEIARELGLYSNGGNPHIMAVSAIIKRLHIAASEIVTTAFSRNGHDDVTVQYKPSVFEEIKLWLAENGYPTKISYTDSKGNPKTCTVVYREVA